MYMYILDKVSFDSSLYQKKLTKAVKQVHPSEMPCFKSWRLKTFDHKYKKELTRIFEN